MKRKYLPTFADLVDRLSICQLKAIFLPEMKEEYEKEMKLIMHDIDAMGIKVDAEMIRAILVVMLANRYMWENEFEGIRRSGESQDGVLRLTHSVNGVRNRAKNVISNKLGERIDLKIDCLAAKMLKDKGMDWEIW